jgi:hypothetical protein
MKKPDELIELLQSLREDGERTTVSLGPDAKAVVYIGKNELTLPGRDCVLLLSTEETVENFFESIGQPEDARIELIDLYIEDEVKAALAERFSAVVEQ